MLDYQIKRSSRSLSLRISINSNGKVIVGAPKLMPEFLIHQFVSKQQPWIETQLAKVNARKLQLKQDQVSIFGKLYDIKLNHQATRMGVTTKDNAITINNLHQKTPSQIKAQLDAFLKKTAHKYIATRANEWGKAMGVHYQELKLREQSTRWGSCSSKGNLNFNWRLVHYPPAVIDYVIIHELAHRLELNHSARFWAIVKRFDPGYALHKGQLRQKRYH